MRGATLTQTGPEGHQRYSADTLEVLFEQCFGERFRTRLVGGAEEPLYRAPQGARAATIHYRHDYFRSALHEVAHWCVAGTGRRLQDDYGYWYAPDGRSQAQQKDFEQVEVLPQAWELLFCAACAHPFKVSMDNLDNSPGDVSGFEQAVQAQATALLRKVPRDRGWLFVQALAVQYRRSAGFQRAWIRESFASW